MSAGVTCLEVASGMVDQHPLYNRERAGDAAGNDAGRVTDSTAWTVSAAPDEERLAGDRGSAIEIAQPERIVLLGSASRGEIVDDRELDLLVVANPRHGRSRGAGAAVRQRASRLRAARLEGGVDAGDAEARP